LEKVEQDMFFSQHGGWVFGDGEAATLMRAAQYPSLFKQLQLGIFRQ
jgi:hypothetical protein